MARTKLFSQIRRAMAQARFAQRKGWSKSQIECALQSRREFLKASALLALPVAAGLPSTPFFLSPDQIAPSKRDPVLILGGGAAGLAAAFTLKKAGVPFHLLEASSRLGGRIFTQAKFNSQNQFVELGAEYIDTDHKTLINLAAEIGIEVQNMGEDELNDVEPETFYFHGVPRNHEDLVAAAGPVADAVAKVKREIGPQFNYRNVNLAGVKWDKITLAEFLESLRGQAEDWVLDAVHMGYLLEMGREPEEQSCLNLMWQMDDNVSDGFELFGPSDETRRIVGGNSRLIDRLGELLGDDVHRSTRVIKMDRRGNKIRIIADQSGRTVEYASNQVICTLPFSTLREVDGLRQLGLSPAKLRCINEILYGQNAKLIMEFETRYWRQKHGRPKGSSGWVISDLQSQSFWETSRAQDGAHGILTNFMGGHGGLNSRRELVESMILPEINQLWPGVSDLFIKATAANWNLMPMAKGSYICVGPGQYTDFFGAQMEPELNGQLLFAGEHTSVDYMGFMNGALETGIAAARTVLKSRRVLEELVS